MAEDDDLDREALLKEAFAKAALYERKRADQITADLLVLLPIGWLDLLEKAHRFENESAQTTTSKAVLLDICRGVMAALFDRREGSFSDYKVRWARIFEARMAGVSMRYAGGLDNKEYFWNANNEAQTGGASIKQFHYDLALSKTQQTRQEIARLARQFEVEGKPDYPKPFVPKQNVVERVLRQEHPQRPLFPLTAQLIARAFPS